MRPRIGGADPSRFQEGLEGGLFVIELNVGEAEIQLRRGHAGPQRKGSLEAVDGLMVRMQLHQREPETELRLRILRRQLRRTTECGRGRPGVAGIQIVPAGANQCARLAHG